MPAVGVAIVVMPPDILVGDVDEVASTKVLQEALRVAPASRGRTIDCTILHVHSVRLHVIHGLASLVAEIPKVSRSAGLERRGRRTRGTERVSGVCRRGRRVCQSGVKTRSLRPPCRCIIRGAGCDWCLLDRKSTRLNSSHLV